MRHSVTVWLLTLSVTCILATTAKAQPFLFEQADYEQYNYAPVPDFATGELFAPLDLSAYGSGPRPNEGYFFNYDYLRWVIQAPPARSVGLGAIQPAQQDEILVSSLDTSGFESEFNDGSRVEFGYMMNKKGLLFSGFTSYANDVVEVGASTTTGTEGAVIIFNDPFAFSGSDSVALIVEQIRAENKTDLWGGEIMRTWRMPRAQRPFAPTLDLMLGMRYMLFEDDFFVTFESTAMGQDNLIATEGNNNLVGPQVGVRYYQQWGPFSFATEGRFFAAWNFQDLKQRVELDPAAAAAIAALGAGSAIPNAYTNHRDEAEFAPAGEFRVEGAYLVTNKVRVRAGWTGMYLSNIARPSNMVDYSIGRFGFLDENSYEVFTHGIHIGVEVNH